jgi:CDP-glucose 4,6-dehydratase
MCLLLNALEIPFIGLSLPAKVDSLYNKLEFHHSIKEYFVDIRNGSQVNDVINKVKPNSILHMAAQPLVLESYKNPSETFETNLMGTVNVLSGAFHSKYTLAVGIVTTDKVYKNQGNNRRFIESDELRGTDPYSASKVAAENAVQSWQQIKKVSSGPKVVSYRAGNVIGGGDMAQDRLLPDFVRGFSSGEIINIRNPNSTRPWQHALDPLFGYLLGLEASLYGEISPSYNFGPSNSSMKVGEVSEIIQSRWGNLKVDVSRGDENGAESKYLDLDSSLAKAELSWNPRWNQEESIIRTLKWWDSVFSNELSAVEACESDIVDYLGTHD